MAQGLRALTALAEDPDFSSHTASYNVCNPKFRRSDAFSASAHMWCKDIHACKTFIHIK